MCACMCVCLRRGAAFVVWRHRELVTLGPFVLSVRLRCAMGLLVGVRMRIMARQVQQSGNGFDMMKGLYFLKRCVDSIVYRLKN